MVHDDSTTNDEKNATRSDTRRLPVAEAMASTPQPTPMAPILETPNIPSSESRLAMLQKFVLAAKHGNLMKKRLNVWRQERC